MIFNSRATVVRIVALLAQLASSAALAAGLDDSPVPFESIGLHHHHSHHGLHSEEQYPPIPAKLTVAMLKRLHFSSDDNLCKSLLPFIAAKSLGTDAFYNSTKFTLPSSPNSMSANFNSVESKLFFGDVLWDEHPRYFLKWEVGDPGQETDHDEIYIFKNGAVPKFHSLTGYQLQFLRLPGESIQDAITRNRYLEQKTIDFYVSFKSNSSGQGFMGNWAGTPRDDTEDQPDNIYSPPSLGTPYQIVFAADDDELQAPFVYKEKIYFYAYSDPYPWSVVIYRLSAQKKINVVCVYYN